MKIDKVIVSSNFHYGRKEFIYGNDKLYKIKIDISKDMVYMEDGLYIDDNFIKMKTDELIINHYWEEEREEIYNNHYYLFYIDDRTHYNSNGIEAMNSYCTMNYSEWVVKKLLE